MLPDRGFFAGLYCLLRLDRLEQKAKLYYGNYCCKMDFDLHIDENETPKDMLNGMCIHFEVSTIDIW